MSNFSNIGFDVKNEEELRLLVEKVYQKSSPIETNKGTYFRYSDESGAELWIQMNKENEVIGINPHFKGKSKRKVSIIASIDRPESILDGAFYSWADPMEKDNPESGDYPFVFDVPNHKEYEGIEIPQFSEIQLSAFTQELTYYKSENAFVDEQKHEVKWASRSFIPIGLFGQSQNAPEAFGVFVGIIKEIEKKKNKVTEQKFYWMLVETLGGEVDVLADFGFFENNKPELGGIIHGQFWLSGTLIKVPNK